MDEVCLKHFGKLFKFPNTACVVVSILKTRRPESYRDRLAQNDVQTEQDRLAHVEEQKEYGRERHEIVSAQATETELQLGDFLWERKTTINLSATILVC